MNYTHFRLYDANGRWVGSAPALNAEVAVASHGWLGAVHAVPETVEQATERQRKAWATAPLNNTRSD